eukprot:53648-Chlamydomonas_euryale.AAC.3
MHAWPACDAAATLMHAWPARVASAARHPSGPPPPQTLQNLQPIFPAKYVDLKDECCNPRASSKSQANISIFLPPRSHGGSP